MLLGEAILFFPDHFEPLPLLQTEQVLQRLCPPFNRVTLQVPRGELPPPFEPQTCVLVGESDHVAHALPCRRTTMNRNRSRPFCAALDFTVVLTETAVNVDCCTDICFDRGRSRCEEIARPHYLVRCVLLRPAQIVRHVAISI